MNLPLFLSLAFFLTVAIGSLLKKIRIPWIFGALLVGLGVAFFAPDAAVTKTPSFQFMADLGVYFLLFIIGYEINLRNFKLQAKFLGTTALKIITAEAITGTLLIHFFFDINWLVAMIVAASFATIGEAILVPILEEFGIIKSRLGQVIFGVGVIDDVIEILTIVLASLLITNNASSNLHHIVLVFATLIFLFVLPKLLSMLGIRSHLFKTISFDFMFLTIVAFIFFFIGVSIGVDLAPMAAILAGVAAQNLVSHRFRKQFESEIKALCYGFFGPIFFMSVGLTTDVGVLGEGIGLILLLTAATSTAKIVSTYFSSRKMLGKKGSIVAGVCFTARLSTSIVLIKLFLDNGLIDQRLYSVLVGTTIVTQLVSPTIISLLLNRWQSELKLESYNLEAKAN